MQNTTVRNRSWEMAMGFEALYAGRGRRNPVWSGKEAHWSLRGLIVKSAEHCGADYKPLDSYINCWSLRCSWGIALLQRHLHSQLNTWLQWIGQRQLQDDTRDVYVWGLTVVLVEHSLTVSKVSTLSILFRPSSLRGRRNGFRRRFYGRSFTTDLLRYHNCQSLWYYYTLGNISAQHVLLVMNIAWQ